MTHDGEPGTPGLPAASGNTWAYSSRYDDIDAQAAHFQGFGQHYQQLSAGPFDGQFHSFNFGPDLAIHREGANRELVQSATTPRGRFGLSVLDEKSPPCVLHAATLGRDDMILYPSGQTIEGKTPERMRILCIDLDARLLLEHEHAAPGVQIVGDARGTSELREVVRAGIATFQSRDAQLHRLARGPGVAYRNFQGIGSSAGAPPRAHARARGVQPRTRPVCRGA
jgi:hypothetical protein